MKLWNDGSAKEAEVLDNCCFLRSVGISAFVGLRVLEQCAVVPRVGFI
jgi:hypothetical protein